MLEQHLYTFLYQRYGLKSLIAEWATALVHGLKRFQDDNDVLVFAKIIRNEVEEEFRFTQAALRDSVKDLVKVYVQGTNTGLASGHINALVAQLAADEELLSTEMWEDVVRYMYNSEDAAQIVAKVESAAPRGIKYSAFVSILLEFQLKGHEKYVAKVVHEFRAVDSDGDGIVSRDEARALIEALGTPADLGVVLDALDPRSLGKITFSQVVHQLQAELGRDA